MIIRSYGCSFIFGTDLADDGRNGPYATPSNFTWPALTAAKLQQPYVCRAKGGAGNLQILDCILRDAACNEQSLFLIGWSYCDRFDYGDLDTSSTTKDYTTICPITNSPEAKTYYKNFHSEFRDKFTTLINIKVAIDILKEKKCPFVMTCMDSSLIFDQNWHVPLSIIELQNQVRPYITDFDGKNFLHWSQDNKFDISKTSHPLEHAHQAASEYLWPHAQSALKNYNLV